MDTNSAGSISTTNIEICDCNQIDPDNQCLFGTILLAVNPFVKIVRCSCTKYYTGNQINFFIF